MSEPGRQARIPPHVTRHTTAMHLLQVGIDVATIALWLGHERLETTHHYVEADLQLKERARRNLDPLGQGTRRFKADSSLLTFHSAAAELPPAPLVMKRGSGHGGPIARGRVRQLAPFPPGRLRPS